MSRRSLIAVAATASGLFAFGGVGAVGGAQAAPAARARHVLLLSVDGLHQSDLAWYVAAHPDSALGKLVAGGTEYTHAQTTFPSDSFPGMVAQLTGGGPGTSGVYYDDTFNHILPAPGTRDCATCRAAPR